MIHSRPPTPAALPSVGVFSVDPVMTDHLAKAKEYRDHASSIVERAQLEINDKAQSSLYLIAERYLVLAEMLLKAADQEAEEQPEGFADRLMGGLPNGGRDRQSLPARVRRYR